MALASVLDDVGWHHEHCQLADARSMARRMTTMPGAIQVQVRDDVGTIVAEWRSSDRCWREYPMEWMEWEVR